MTVFPRLPMHAQAQESTTQLKCLWDGLHDVAPCLQREIDEAAREGRGPIFPAGTWPLGRALVLDSNMRIDGYRRVTLIPTANNSESSLLLKGLNVTNVHITGITFDGGSTPFERTAPVIRVTHGNKITFEITVLHAVGIGVVIEGNTSRSGVKNSRFMDVGNRWKLTLARQDRSQGLVSCCGSSNNRNYAIGNRFENIGLDALQLSDQINFRAIDNLFILENDQRKLLSSPDYPSAIFAPDSSYSTISRNNISGAPGNCIDAPGLQNSVISDNSIGGCGGAGIGIFLGYDGHTQPKDLLVNRNIIRRTDQWAWSATRGAIFISHGAQLQSIFLQNNLLGGS
jgi:hypothetical protein